MPLDRKHTPIYLNDHLAGATVGLALARRALSNNRGTAFEGFLGTLAQEIDEDRETLREIMRRLDVSEDLVKRVVALGAEVVGRLKLNGSLFGYSPLSRLVELEGLMLGVTGKLGLWRALGQAGDARLAEYELDALASRAEAQRDGLELGSRWPNERRGVGVADAVPSTIADRRGSAPCWSPPRRPPHGCGHSGRASACSRDP
jgi:hypothetical protein